MNAVNALSQVLQPGFEAATNLSEQQLLDAAWKRFATDLSGDALASGDRSERLWKWIRTTFRSACDKAAEAGQEVWNSLHDEETRHNYERLAIVYTFILANFGVSHAWSLHELTTFVMLILSVTLTRDKTK